jgi:glycosyltransferase involved in cell wall biosynthesis
LQAIRVRTDAPVAIVFEPFERVADGLTPSFRAERTARALARLDVAHAHVIGPQALAKALANAAKGVWILRAGAVPLRAPRVPTPSATRRPLLGLGATENDTAWKSFLAVSAGEFAGGHVPLPIVRSVFIESPASFAAVVARIEVAKEQDLVTAACAQLASVARVVRVAPFDVTYLERLHVLELVTTLHRGGAERVVLDLTRELRSGGLGVTLAVLDRASRATFAVPPGTIVLEELAHDRTSRLDALAAIAVASGVDVVHAHLVRGDDLKRLQMARIPLVTTVHNSEPAWPANLDVLSGSDVALAVACSRDVEAQLVRAGRFRTLRTVWNGIANEREAKRRVDASKELRIVVVANHRPQKRLERLPAVVARLAAMGCAARVTIVGEPLQNVPAAVEIQTHVMSEATRCGVAEALTFVGPRDDVAALYRNHDVLVSMSAFEGLSLVHLEALSAGLPVVTTAVAGTEELARKHTQMHVVPLDASPELVAETIVAAMDVARTAEPGTLTSDFRAATMAARHAELFARVTASSRRAREGLMLVANNFSTGGAQSSARRLLIRLASAGVRVRAVVIQEQSAYPTAGRTALQKAGIEVIVAPRAGDADPLVTARTVARSVDEFRPEALLFWNVITQHKILLADMLLDTKIWDVSPGEMYFASFERYLEKPRTGLPYLTMRDYGRRLEGVIVKYAAERERAQSTLFTAVHVVPNGIEVPARLPERRLHDGPRVVGTLARLSKDKKLEQLIDAMASCATAGRVTGIELRIAGAVDERDQAYFESLVARSQGLPIHWVGERNASDFLREIDLFAMVSEPSGCPNASLEAMAEGLAVVATDVGGAGEQVVHGETGLLVPRGDADALGAAIVELARNPSRRIAMGRAGHARALSHFDVGRMAADYARICLGREL